MKGVSFLMNEKNEKIAVQIDLKTINNFKEEIEDLLDGIVAESRKEEERVPLATVIKKMR
jgi:hypothetical protein